MATVLITQCLERDSADPIGPLEPPAQPAARRLQRSPRSSGQSPSTRWGGRQAQHNRGGSTWPHLDVRKIWDCSGVSWLKAKSRDHLQHELTHRVRKQNDPSGATPVASRTTRLASISAAVCAEPKSGPMTLC